MRTRFLFLAMLMISMFSVIGSGSVSAQSPTPITIPTPTSEGCDQIGVYLDARQKIFDEMILGMEAVFPDVATPLVDHGDELVGAMMMMTADQYLALAKVYSDAADKIEKVDAPAIAKFYNDIIVETYRVSAKVFEEAAATDLNTAGVKYSAQLIALGPIIETYGTAATAICPAFADVVTLDQTQATL
jgi:hypothetical protein